MLWPECQFIDTQDSLQERLGPLVVALLNIEDSQIVEACGGIAMFMATHLLIEVQGPLQELLGSLVVALFVIEDSQIVEKKGDLRILLCGRLLPETQSAQIEWLSLLILGALEQIVCCPEQ